MSFAYDSAGLAGLMHDFLRWGPHGFYATFVLMLLSIPLGWLYAYIAFIGYHKDITVHDPRRRRAAIGGAIIIAVMVFVWRHLLVTDINDYPLRDIIGWAEHVLFAMTNAIGEWLAQRMQTSGPLGRIFWACVTVVAVPASVGLVLFGMMAVIILVFVLGAATMLASFMAVVASLGAALWAFPGFLMGLPVVWYFLFVRLPLQVVYRGAIREGRWPTTPELVDALRRGTLVKKGWQSDIMAYKAAGFTTSLENETERIRNLR